MPMSLASQMMSSLILRTLAHLLHMAQVRLYLCHGMMEPPEILSGFDYMPMHLWCVYLCTYTDKQLDDVLASESREAEGLIKYNKSNIFQSEFGKNLVRSL